MRSFYLEYSQGEFLHPAGTEAQESILHPSCAEFKPATLPALLAEVGWKKNVIIMPKCKDPSEREFYIKIY
jgi:hypothetical protein